MEMAVAAPPAPVVPNVLCCECGVSIPPNPTGMCISCLRQSVDVTEGISTNVSVYQCRNCQRWLRPPWTNCELESRELMALCLRKINGLGGVKLVDTCWVWTEPHSRRLKTKLTVQKEVVNGAVLQQSFIVEFVIRNQQCQDCQRAFAEGSWQALVQLRQRVDHKRTFFYLEQLLLKHGAHEKASGIQALRDGMDFYFETRSHASHFLQFIGSAVPCKTRHSRKLVGADLKSNTYNFKYTYYTEIAPTCKDDLVYLPAALANDLGNLSRLCLVQKVNNHVTFIDPLTCQRGEVDADKYWRHSMDKARSLASSSQMIEYTVLGSEPVLTASQVHVASKKRQARAAGRNKKRKSRNRGVDEEDRRTAPSAADEASVASSGSKRRADVSERSISRRHRLADVTVARTSDLGSNDQTFLVRSHLGHLLRAGDLVLGYDVQGTNFATIDDDVDADDFPEVILVRKLRGHGGRRRWHVKKIDEVVQAEDADEGAAPRGKKKRAERQAQQAAEDEAAQYEQFLQQLEVDAEMRSNVNIYKNQQAAAAAANGGADSMETGEEGDEPEDVEDIRMDELLDALTLDDADADPDDDDAPAIFADQQSAPGASANAEQTQQLMNAVVRTEGDEAFMPKDMKPPSFL